MPSPVHGTSQSTRSKSKRVPSALYNRGKNCASTLVTRGQGEPRRWTLWVKRSARFLSISLATTTPVGNGSASLWAVFEEPGRSRCLGFLLIADRSSQELANNQSRNTINAVLGCVAHTAYIYIHYISFIDIYFYIRNLGKMFDLGGSMFFDFGGRKRSSTYVPI